MQHVAIFYVDTLSCSPSMSLYLLMAGSKLQCAPKAVPSNKLMTYRCPREAYAVARAATAVVTAVMVRNTVRGVPRACRYCSGT